MLTKARHAVLNCRCLLVSARDCRNVDWLRFARERRKLCGLRTSRCVWQLTGVGMDFATPCALCERSRAPTYLLHGARSPLTQSARSCGVHAAPLVSCGSVAVALLPTLPPFGTILNLAASSAAKSGARGNSAQALCIWPGCLEAGLVWRLWPGDRGVLKGRF